MFLTVILIIVCGITTGIPCFHICFAFSTQAASPGMDDPVILT